MRETSGRLQKQLMPHLKYIQNRKESNFNCRAPIEIEKDNIKISGSNQFLNAQFFKNVIFVQAAFLNSCKHRKGEENIEINRVG